MRVRKNACERFVTEDSIRNDKLRHVDIGMEVKKKRAV